MKIIKADNYQTWYIEENNQALLIDPWLSNKLKPDKSFFIQREKENVIYISNDQIKKVKAIIITAPFDDHLHLESIEKLSSKLPIYTSKIVKKILSKRNVKNPIYLLDKKGTEICSIKVKSLPTSYPYFSSTFSIIFEDKKSKRIFHEGHIVNFNYIKLHNIKADVAILTAEEVKLFGVITLGMDYKETLKACNILSATNLFITGSNPGNTKGFISKFLRIKPLKNNELGKKLNLYHKAGATLDLNNSFD